MLDGQTDHFIDHSQAPEFRSKFEHIPFLFHHRLTSSALLSLDALRELCRYCQDRKEQFHFEMTEAAAGDAFAPIDPTVTLLDAFDGLGDKTLILLKKIHSHPLYAKLLDEILAEVSDLLGVSFYERYRKPICTIILASPNRVTQYHIDDAENLLFQVHGTKKFYVFDGNDRDILSARDLEEYWGAGNSRVARYSDAVQAKAMLYALGPGTGVHVPLTFPHWVLTGPEVSVAMSINFQQINCAQSNLHRANYMLRRFGLKPHEPGANEALDTVKSSVMQAALSASRWVKTRRPAA